jgi:hypothetical protein
MAVSSTTMTVKREISGTGQKWVKPEDDILLTKY